MDEPFPYNLPMFRRWHEATSPDGVRRAWMTATEISMSNPTIGMLWISDGTQVDHCNPSFLWSDDSRYLAVPQWRFFLGLRLRQRVLMFDFERRLCFRSAPLGWFVQPQSFASGLLVVQIDPMAAAPREVRWSVPEDLEAFGAVAF